MGDIYSDFMGETSTTTTGSFVALTGSPYTPLVNGRLRKLKLYLAGDAVTSLVEDVAVRVRSPSFGGVDAWVMAVGANIRTAPAFPIPVGETVLDLPVKASSKMTLEVIQRTGATPVTPQYALIGVFEKEG